MSDPIYQTFSGKNLFFTGLTGFVGKVFLFKVLKEFPDIEGIYCLCRPKKKMTMQERFEKEVLSSPCFLPLIKEIGETEWKRRISKVHAVAGDITFHRLGLSESDYAMLTEKLNLIVHMAATVDFQEKLNVSINMNCLGSLRVLALAQRCKNIEAFIHTSTCYVNYNRYGEVPVQEALYPLPFDPEAMAKYIMALHDEQVPIETDRLLKQYNFPNTYTFTKNLTEHILAKRRGTVPLAIVRPAIIGAAWREPYNGWVDALTAAGGLFLTVGLGVLHDVVGSMQKTTDVVPVDHVVNILLKAVHKTVLQFKSTPAVENGSKGPSGLQIASSSAKDGNTNVDTLAVVANAGKAPADETSVSDPGASLGPHNGVRVYQASTSSTMNPLRWEIIKMSLIPYWRDLKHPKAMGPPSVTFHKTWTQFEVAFFVKQRLPLLFLQAANSIPGIRSEKRAQLLARYDKALFRTRDLNKQFYPFITNEWRFECTNSDALDELLTPAAQKAFSHDVFDINWHHYGVAYSWGMIRFIMKDDKEQPIMPPSGTEQVMKAFL